MGKHTLTMSDVLAIQNVQKKLHGQAKEMGWHDTPREIGTLIALCHSEYLILLAYWIWTWQVQ